MSANKPVLMIADPVERIVATGLAERGIQFVHEPDDTNLDFYLPKYGVYIECKRFHSERSNEQLSRAANVILIQGYEAAHCFANMLKGLSS